MGDHAEHNPIKHDREIIPATVEMTEGEFRSLWFSELNFCSDGKPEDAALYLEEVLSAIESDKNYLKAIGDRDGQQEFMFQWLLSVGLVRSDTSPRRAGLTEKGRRMLAALHSNTHFPVFDLD
jgi:hypothetical protein